MTPSAPLTSHLADVVCAMAGSPLPEAIVAKTRLCLLDFIASSLAGARSEVAATGRAMLPAFGAGEATLLARPERSSVLGAAFFNGLVATVEDLDDSHRFASGLHLSAVTFPAGLALAEARGCSGQQLLRAAAAGYEIAARMARAADAGLRARGFHSTGAVGPFGACATACVLLGLDAKRTAHALGIAASGAGGLFAFLAEGASVRHAHAAWASTNGLLAALLAEQGLSGPSRALEGRDGFFPAYTTGFDEDILRRPSPTAGGDHEIANAYHKLFSACGHALPAITGLLELRERLLPELDRVQRIEVRGYEASAALTNPDPATVGEAKFSLPFIVALALLFGDVTPVEMRMDVLRRPEVRRLAGKVSVTRDPERCADYPRRRSGELVITLADGTSLRKYVDAPIGMPENPVDRDQLARKFRLAAEALLPPAAQDAVLVAIEDLETPPGVQELMRHASGGIDTRRSG